MEAITVKPLYLDTHILVWLYQDGATRITPSAVNAIEEAEQLFISSMVELELTYLHEISLIKRYVSYLTAPHTGATLADI